MWLPRAAPLRRNRTGRSLPAGPEAPPRGERPVFLRSRRGGEFCRKVFYLPGKYAIMGEMQDMQRERAQIRTARFAGAVRR